MAHLKMFPQNLTPSYTIDVLEHIEDDSKEVHRRLNDAKSEWKLDNVGSAFNSLYSEFVRNRSFSKVILRQPLKLIPNAVRLSNIFNIRFSGFVGKV